MKKKVKLIVLPIIGLALTSCTFIDRLTPQDGDGDKTVAKAVYLGEESFNLEVGYTHRLSTILNPYYTTNKTFTWSSSNSNIASVNSEGVVTGVSAGRCTIIVTSNSSSRVTDTCTVNVYEDTTGVNKVKSQYTYEDYVSNNAYFLSCSPSQNESKIVVIPVWFTDSSTYITNRSGVREDIRTAYFGDSETNGWESVKTYYEKDSFGSLSLIGSVTDWFECGQESTYYYKDNDGRTNRLVHSAIDWYKKKYRTENMIDYDRNEDGYIDGVMLIYGAPDYSAMGMSDGSAGNMWAYCYWLQDRFPNVESPAENVYFWASYDFMYSAGTKAINRAGSIYGSGDQSHCNIDSHTFIHEMGHVFGLDDYYDYSGSQSAAAGFSMQDHNVGGHDPYSRFALGWAKAYVPTSTATFEVKAMEDYGECVLLSPSFSGSAFDEYILLELFTPKGVNQQDATYRYSHKMTVNGYGVRVWHVDARLAKVINGSILDLTTSPLGDYKVRHATNNCSYKAGGSRAINYAGSYNYNLLQLITNNTSQNGALSIYSFLNNEMMFHTGDTFSMSKFASQFVNSGQLNSGIDLGWTVTFNSVTEDKMNITCTKL